MIGKILKKLLETKNLKVSELAAMTSLQIPTINNIIQGSSAKRELIQKISLALKVDLLRYIDKKKKVDYELLEESDINLYSLANETVRESILKYSVVIHKKQLDDLVNISYNYLLTSPKITKTEITSFVTGMIEYAINNYDFLYKYK